MTNKTSDLACLRNELNPNDPDSLKQLRNEMIAPFGESGPILH